jgi:hypothetical protein
MIDKPFLYTINSIVNYYANADPTTPIMIKKIGKNVLEKIENLFKEERFFEEWGVYESDEPTLFSDEEKKIIFQLITMAKKDYLSNDVDITAILDPEDFTDIKIDLLDKSEKNRPTLSSEISTRQEKEDVENWQTYWEQFDPNTRSSNS